jgi:acetyl esterase
MPLDPGIQAMLAALASMNAAPMSQGTPEAARAAFRYMTVDLRRRRPESIVPV